LVNSEENKPFDVACSSNLAIVAIAPHQLGNAVEAKAVLEEASRLITRFK
jgi:hypothetical protein